MIGRRALAVAVAALGWAMAAPAQATAVPDPAEGIAPFQRYAVQDRFGRRISFYLSQAESEDRRPLVLFVQGPGCASVFRKTADGRVDLGAAGVLARVAGMRARILVVEKPTVGFLEAHPAAGVSADGCPAAFHAEHTLPRWVAALSAALAAARAMPGIDADRTLAAGHAEGALAAASLAAAHSEVGHVATLAAGGPTQLFELAEAARRPQKPGEPSEAREERAAEVFHTWERIAALPDSDTDFAWGHAYRRWSSFLATSVLDELLAGNARVFLAHGTRDETVPIAAFDVLRAELARNRRDVAADRREGADHELRRPWESESEGWAAVFGTMLNWFLDEPP